MPVHQHRHALEVSCTGLARGKAPAPCLTVIFGASGDLAKRKLVPSFHALERQGLLAQPFALIGNGRRPWSDDDFRAKMRAAVEKEEGFCEKSWASFARALHFVSGDLNNDRTYADLRVKIEALQAEKHLPDNVLFHLSTAPEFYAEIVERAGAGGLLESDRGWRRVIIEKPFGHDGQSARELDRRLHAVLNEDQLYHIDHYLGKETVQNMLVFRFANPAFESTWNRNFIDHVQITAAETVGIEERAGFYDGAGAIRDMIQNHLLQVLCLVAMEPAVRYDATSLRNETLKVLEAIAPPDVDRDCVTGQYAAGAMNGKAAVGYRDEKNVADDSTTPTFAALKLHINNWRWAGTPFYLRSGKRLPRKVTEITIRFKPTPHLMFPLAHPDDLQANTLTFRLQPDEGILQTFHAKQPGPGLCLGQVSMNMAYDQAFQVDRLPEAYEWLLLDAMHGDPTLFPRSDWIDRAWSIVDPWIKQADEAKKIDTYAAGSWGPERAARLIEDDGRKWLVS